MTEILSSYLSQKIEILSRLAKCKQQLTVCHLESTRLVLIVREIYIFVHPAKYTYVSWELSRMLIQFSHLYVSNILTNATCSDNLIADQSKFRILQCEWEYKVNDNTKWMIKQCEWKYKVNDYTKWMIIQSEWEYKVNDNTKWMRIQSEW
jgi:hypothetical protein